MIFSKKTYTLKLECIFENYLLSSLVLFKIKVPYIFKTKYEIERERNNQRLLDVFRDKPDITISIVAELLGLKESYINTSIKQLKEQGKLYHKRTGMHTGAWIVVDE